MGSLHSLPGSYISGAIPALAYQRDRAAFHAVKWLPPSWQWIDPLKDAQAAILSMNNLIRLRSEIVAERGYDIEALDAEIAADRARADALGIAPVLTAPSQQEEDAAVA
jgi:capsid protein